MNLRQVTAPPTSLSHREMHSFPARGDVVKREASSVRDLKRALIRTPALSLTVMEWQVHQRLAPRPSSLQQGEQLPDRIVAWKTKCNSLFQQAPCHIPHPQDEPPRWADGARENSHQHSRWLSQHQRAALSPQARGSFFVSFLHCCEEREKWPFSPKSSLRYFLPYLVHLFLSTSPPSSLESRGSSLSLARWVFLQWEFLCSTCH